MLLPTDKTRHVGEAVAMVVAETRRRRSTPPRRSQSTTSRCPGSPTRRTPWRRTRRAIWDEVPDNIAGRYLLRRSRGDGRAFARADHVIAMDFHVGRVTGVPLEPRAALGIVRCGDRPLHAFCRSGGAVRQKREIAAVLEIAPETLRVLSYDVGGNFGTRNRTLSNSGSCCGPRASSAVRSNSPPPRTKAFLTDYQGRDLVTEVSLALRKRRPLPGDARDQSQQSRRALRVAFAVEQGRRPDHRPLRHPGRDLARARGLHQHDADPGIPQLRPAGGDVCDRAA